VTNALGWAAATPVLVPPVATADQTERYPAPTSAASEECYAITERLAPTSTRSSHRPPRRRLALNGVKWHVTSYNTADYVLPGEEGR
jgi:hypothetical protein